MLKALELKKMKYYCQVCEQDLDQEEKGLLSIYCDGCLHWLHLSCAGLKVAAKRKEWFCQLCRSTVHNIKKQKQMYGPPDTKLLQSDLLVCL